MRYHGLFVGIDRYASPDISWLSCAVRDATALHALFADTLGDGGELLTNEQATRGAIQKRFDALATCDPDDIVIMAFSGHGSPTHELITCDTDVRALASTSIPLAELTDWFARIPARQLICFLDCCFSGGMGAKVLQTDVAPRSMNSTSFVLDQLAGEGRLILTASAATEAAWEHARIGHGLLTYYLLEALQGAPEVRQAGKVSIYRVLEHVTERVTNAAAQFGAPQHPTLRGRIDSALSWPVFAPGLHYAAAFPERARVPISADIQSLEGYGFPPHLLEAWAGAIPALNSLQLAAINDFGLLDGEHLIVSAPTSSGKTMVGELAALKGVVEGRRAFFLLPLKALVNDKHRQFTRLYEPFGLTTIRATGEIADDIPALMRGRYDVCLMTYEKFAALALAAPHILDQVGTIVVDEVQMIADPTRGANLEFLLTLLRMRRAQGIEPQLIALSAVIGDTNGLERWLGARLLLHAERPVPLDEGVLRADGSFRYIDGDTGEERVQACIRPAYATGKHRDWLIPLVRRLVQEGKQVIVFRETKGETVFTARYVAESLGLPAAQEALEALPEGDPSAASAALRGALAGGVAFHNADLDRDERLVIEEQFRTPGTKLRVIAATTTLAMGVNTPASAVVIEGLEHPGTPPALYAVAEYKNMVGRAGRVGYAERGTAYLLALTPLDEHHAWERYVRGTPEDVQSRFLDRSLDIRSIVIRVLATAQRVTDEGLSTDDVVQFLEGSFAAFQQRQATGSWQWERADVERALHDLAQHNLVEITASGAYSLTPLGRLAGEGGVEVATIVRLVEVLRPINMTPLGGAALDATLITAAQVAVELDSEYVPFNKKSTRQEPHVWAAELQGQLVPYPVLSALSRWSSDSFTTLVRAKRAVACLLWMTATPFAQVERTMTRFGGAPGGASGPLRSTWARTADILPAVARVAEILHPEVNLGEWLPHTLARIELGLPRALADLAVAAGSRLTRAEYLSLLQAGLADAEDIEKSEDERLLACLSGNLSKLSVVRRVARAVIERHASDEHMQPILPAPDALPDGTDN